MQRKELLKNVKRIAEIIIRSGEMMIIANGKREGILKRKIKLR